jgi:hypothetical protein
MYSIGGICVVSNIGVEERGELGSFKPSTNKRWGGQGFSNRRSRKLEISPKSSF